MHRGWINISDGQIKQFHELCNYDKEEIKNEFLKRERKFLFANNIDISLNIYFKIQIILFKILFCFYTNTNLKLSLNWNVNEAS